MISINVHITLREKQDNHLYFKMENWLSWKWNILFTAIQLTSSKNYLNHDESQHMILTCLRKNTIQEQESCDAKQDTSNLSPFTNMNVTWVISIKSPQYSKFS
jgi:hypothetical protein